MPNKIHQAFSFALVLIVFGAVGGCRAPYALRGKVISSATQGHKFTELNDPDPLLLPGNGVFGARIDIVRYPRTLQREVVASGQSGPEGVFDIKLHDFQWEWGKEEWLFLCVHPDYPIIEFFGDLPVRNSDYLLLIELGQAGLSHSENDSLDENERIRRELERFER